MNNKEMEWEGTDFIFLAQDKYRRQELVNAVMKFRVP
jgi:hypothetical protein